MPRPGEYRPDPTIGIGHTEDLQDQGQRPEPQLPGPARPCPHCSRKASRDPDRPAAPFTTWATPAPGGPATSSCSVRGATTATAASTSTPHPIDLARPRQPLHPPGRRVSPSAGSSRTACPIAPPNGRVVATTACSSPMPRSRTRSRPGGKGRRGGSDAEHGRLGLWPTSRAISAVNELYERAVLRPVDRNNRTFKRLTYQVLDHDPTGVNITAFFRRFHRPSRRGLTLQGITTDGSALYPGPITEVFDRDPTSTLHLPHPARGDQGGPLGRGPEAQAAGGHRTEVAAQAGLVPRRPPKLRPAARSGSSGKSAYLFDHRYLFVRRHLSPPERGTLRRISRGLPSSASCAS